MVPLRSIAEPRLIVGRKTIIRYNNYRSVTVNGAPAPGRSSGESLAAMERLSDTTLPTGYSYEWTGTALQEKEAAGQTAIILGLAVLFRLSIPRGALRKLEIPVPVLLSVSVASSAPWHPCGSRTSTTTCMPRSGSSC
jgi:HAE1 family hydrophobic/amphiphilic exporter-1